MTGRVRTILTDDHPTLCTPSDEVGLADPMLADDIADLAATLDDFRARAGFGRAISAPQIGISKRLVVMNLGAGAIPLINPTITERSADIQRVWDDCLSVPDKLVLVERHRRVSVRYHTLAGHTVSWNDLSPELSELLQHELDHLDGILMTDRVVEGSIRPLADRAVVAPAPPTPRLRPGSIVAQRSRIDPVFVDSPQLHRPPLNEALGCTVLLKDETDNPIGNFKGRGASVLIADLASTAGRGSGIVAASAGNWGQAVAHACRHHGLSCTVYAARSANPLKVEAMRELGAEVVLTGDDFDEAKVAAKEQAVRTGTAFVEDGEDLAVTEGHGSIAVELLGQPDLAPLDAVLVPVGNGALLAGTACWFKAASPATRVIGVGPVGAPAMRDAWANPTVPARWSTAAVDTIADGLAVRTPIPNAVDDLARIVDEFVLVTDEHITEAMGLLHQLAGITAEPAGAAGIAAILADRPRFAGHHVAVVISGGNVDPDHRRFLTDAAG